MYAKPGKEAEVKRELLKMVEPSRKDAGSVQYNLHQATDDPRRFVFYENWASREALDKHLQTPHLVHFGEVSKELLEESRIVTYTRIA